MTVTERLRELLDERGVGWDYGIAGAATTRFRVNGIDLTYTPMRDGLLCSTILTPEQAIYATLGRTCHEVVDKSKDWYTTVCSECGFTLAVEEYGPNNFCPNCGRRVMNE